MPQHIGYQKFKIRILLQITKILFLISQITPIVIEQVFLCFKIRLKSLCLNSVLKLLKYLNSVDKVRCFNVIRFDNLKGQFMSLRLVFSAYGFLYKILSTSVNHKGFIGKGFPQATWWTCMHLFEGLDVKIMCSREAQCNTEKSPWESWYYKTSEKYCYIARLSHNKMSHCY